MEAFGKWFRSILNEACVKSVPLMLSVLFVSCFKEDAPLPEPKLVVEGWINSDGYPEVLLTLSAVPSGEEASIEDNIIRWGKVSISDGEQEVVLTGSPSADYLPPFRYYTYDMVGVPGRSYTLTASFGGRSVTSTVTMPVPTPVKRIESSLLEGNKALRNITLWLTAPEDSPAYYHVSTRVVGVDNRFYPSMLGTVEAANPGEQLCIPVYRGGGLGDDECGFVPQIPAGNDVLVRIERITPEVFRFWHAFDNASVVGGSVFLGSTISLPTNISGGYGVWSAQGVTEVRISKVLEE